MFIKCKQIVYVMEILRVLATPKRGAVVEHVLNNPSLSIEVRGISKRTGTSPALVSRVVGTLRKAGLVKDDRVDAGNAMARALKILLNIRKIAVFIPVVRRVRWVVGVGVYGSWASGTNTEKSDLDLWIRVRKPVGEEKIAAIERVISQRTGVECSIVVVDDERMRKMRESDKPFYYALANSFTLWGEGIA